MVILMAIIVTPLGVVAAVYLHEYAGKNSLDQDHPYRGDQPGGVPSIVYGVFGLGSSSSTPLGQHRPPLLPGSAAEPDLRLPGVIWSALTLAILTLPVVIVSTEEGWPDPEHHSPGFAGAGCHPGRDPVAHRAAMASPAIMTGLILAIARAAGEVAPLMLVGW